MENVIPPMLIIQDKHNLEGQKVARALGQSSTGCRFVTQSKSKIITS